VTAATTDKEATDKRVVEEAAEKVTADKEAANKRTADEAIVKGAAVGAVGDSPASGQAPSLVVGTKRAAAPLRRPNDPTGAFGNLVLSSPPPFVARLHSEYISFLHSSSSSDAATAMGIVALAAGTTATEVVVSVTLGPATGGEPQTPEGSLKTCWRSQRWCQSRCLRW
jgi:hypothetical protein